LVIVVILLAIALIPIIDDLSPIKQQKNTWRFGSENGSVEDLSLASNHHTIKKHKINVVR